MNSYYTVIQDKSFKIYKIQGLVSLTTSLIKVSLEFKMLTSEIHQYFMLKKCEKLLQSFFFNKKYQFLWLNCPKKFDEMTS